MDDDDNLIIILVINVLCVSDAEGVINKEKKTYLKMKIWLMFGAN